MSSKKYKLEKLDIVDKVTEVLRDFYDAAELDVLTSVDEVADECVKQLRNTSPKDTGKYARSWYKTQTTKTSSASVYAVHNKKYYRLTHLLENGYVTRSGKRVKGRNHIRAAEAQAEDNLLRRLYKRELGAKK